MSSQFYENQVLAPFAEQVIAALGDIAGRRVLCSGDVVALRAEVMRRGGVAVTAAPAAAAAALDVTDPVALAALAGAVSGPVAALLAPPLPDDVAAVAATAGLAMTTIHDVVRFDNAEQCAAALGVKAPADAVAADGTIRMRMEAALLCRQ